MMKQNIINTCRDCKHRRNGNTAGQCRANMWSNGPHHKVYYCSKFELKLTERGQNIKKGDVVKIKDFSYSRTVENGKLVRPNSSTYGKFVVVEINCNFPHTKNDPWRAPADFNNTVIQATNSGEVIFIQDKYLQPAKHKITVDDKTVEISHESFEAFKKQFIN